MPFQGADNASLYGPSGLRKYLTPDERRRFIAAANACTRDELRTFCLTLAYTGCRISEALALTAGAVERQEYFIALRSLKRRKRTLIVREVPVPESLLRLLCRIHKLANKNPETRLWTFCRSRAWQLVKQVLADAGITQGVHATP
jgi:site-specific recombinase XerD